MTKETAGVEDNRIVIKCRKQGQAFSRSFAMKGWRERAGRTRNSNLVLLNVVAVVTCSYLTCRIHS